MVVLAGIGPEEIVPRANAHDGQNAALDIEPSRVAPGGSIAVLGSDFVSNSPVELRLRTADGDVVIATPTTGDDGHFVADIVIDSDLAARAYEMQAVSGSVSVSSLITVTPNPRPGPARGIAIGVGVLTLSVAALWLVRRRATRPAG